MYHIKRALRTEINSRLRNIDAGLRQQQSSIIQSKLLASDYYKNATSVAVYISMHMEPITDAILSDLLSAESKKVCFVPLITEAEGVIKMYRIYDMNDLTSLQKNRWGIPEPTPYHNNGAESIAREEPGENLDLLIVPGLAFDCNGGRLGRGKGYYDKYLNMWHRLKEQKGVKVPVTASIAFKEQIVPEVPLEQHDRRVDHLIIPTDEEHTLQQ